MFFAGICIIQLGAEFVFIQVREVHFDHVINFPSGVVMGVPGRFCRAHGRVSLALHRTHVLIEDFTGQLVILKQAPTIYLLAISFHAKSPLDAARWPSRSLLSLWRQGL